MMAVSLTLWYAIHRFGHMSRLGAVLRRPAPPVLEGLPNSPHELPAHASRPPAEISEWWVGDEIVGRRVKAVGAEECWLRADLAGLAEQSLTAEADENARIAESVRAYADATRPQAGAKRWVPSLAMVEAAARHAKRIGRLDDMNSRGDRARARFVEQLREAREAEGENTNG